MPDYTASRSIKRRLGSHLREYQMMQLQEFELVTENEPKNERKSMKESRRNIKEKRNIEGRKYVGRRKQKQAITDKAKMK